LDHFEKKEAKKIRNTQLGVVAAREAVSHSRIIEDNVDKDRVGVIWGSGIGGLETLKQKC
jgi:3-oxoacyl-[acyl-carrier-protein] synthase II